MSHFGWVTNADGVQGYTWLKERLQPEEGRRQQDKLREVGQLAERLGCTVTQLVIAWCLKNDSVQCLLLGAASVEQLYENIQSLQVKHSCKTKNILENVKHVFKICMQLPCMIDSDLNLSRVFIIFKTLLHLIYNLQLNDLINPFLVQQLTQLSWWRSI